MSGVKVFQPLHIAMYHLPISFSSCSTAEPSVPFLELCWCIGVSKFGQWRSSKSSFSVLRICATSTLWFPKVGTPSCTTVAASSPTRLSAAGIEDGDGRSYCVVCMSIHLKTSICIPYAKNTKMIICSGWLASLARRNNFSGTWLWCLLCESFLRKVLSCVPRRELMTEVWFSDEE